MPEVERDEFFYPEPEQMDLTERLRRLRNLEKEYTLGFAVEFMQREHGWNILNELERQNTDRTRSTG